MEKEYLQAMRFCQFGERFDGQDILSIQEREDILQTKVLSLLEKCDIEKNEKKENLEYGNLSLYVGSHLYHALKYAVNKGKIRVKQQRDRLVSLNVNEIESDDESPHVSLTLTSHLTQELQERRDYGLFRLLVNQFKCTVRDPHKRIWTTQELKVLTYRFIGEYTRLEVSRKLNLSIDRINKIYRQIDKKILSLPIKTMKGAWFKEVSRGEKH